MRPTCRVRRCTATILRRINPTFRQIPAHAKQDELTITHNYYDHADADRDFNILREVFSFLYAAKPGEIRDLPYPWRRHIYVIPKEWGVKTDRQDVAWLSPRLRQKVWSGLRHVLG
jgi:hypothetical protein